MTGKFLFLFLFFVFSMGLQEKKEEKKFCDIAKTLPEILLVYYFWEIKPKELLINFFLCYSRISLWVKKSWKIWGIKYVGELLYADREVSFSGPHLRAIVAQRVGGWQFVL